MRQGATTDNRIVINLYFTCQLCYIAKNDMVIQYTIMCHMAVGHNEAAVTYFRESFRGCPPVHRSTFTNDCIVTYDRQCIFTLKFQILWNTCNGGMRKNGAVLSDTGTKQYGCLRHHACTITYFCIAVDVGKWFYNHIISKPGFRMYKSH